MAREHISKYQRFVAWAIPPQGMRQFLGATWCSDEATARTYFEAELRRGLERGQHLQHTQLFMSMEGG